jgi:hypothetical protein
MSTKFQKATRRRVYLKLAFTGATGSVKTLGAILTAIGLADGHRFCVLDTENQSASLYSDRYDFDVLNVSPPHTDAKLIEAIQAAVAEKHAVIIIDSFSHFWLWVLDYKNTLDSRGGGNSYVNWGPAGKKISSILDAVLHSPIHVICCMRSKMDYVLEANEKGRMAPRRIGLSPVMRDGIEYEFSTIFDGDLDHFVTVSKDRTGLFIDQRFQVTDDTGRKLLEWLNSAPPPDPAAQPAISLQQQLLNAVADLDPEQLRAFLVARDKTPADGSILDVSESYAQQILTRLPEFREAVNQFRQQPAQPDEPAPPKLGAT